VTAVTTADVDLTRSPDHGVATRLALLAVLTTLTLELVRSSGPLLDRAFASGVTSAASTALVTYAAPGLLVAALLLGGAAGRHSGFPSGRVVLIGTVALAVVRLAVQGLDGQARFVVGLAAVATALAVLTLAVAFVAARPDGGHQAALGLILGVGFSAGLQLALGTVDLFWLHNVLGWVVTAVLAIGMVLLARLVRNETVDVRPRRLWSLGPYLALATMILANPAFVASQTSTRLPWAGGALVVSAAVAFALLLSPTRLTANFRIGCAILLPVAIAIAFLLEGPWVLIALAVAQCTGAVSLATALGSRRSALPTVQRTAGVGVVIGLGTILPLLGYQADYDVPLGFPNAVVIVVTALAMAAAGLRLRTPAAPADAASASAGAPSGTRTIRPARVPVTINPLRLLSLPSVVLAVVGLWTCAPAQASTEVALGSQLRVLDWNLHFGVEPSTTVDLEQIARTIETQEPDVVTLQEVSRGWVMGGGVDMATWLSHRLGMQMVFAPAADRQFGNVILSRSTLTDVEVVPLPYGQGPQHRSAIMATVATADGTPVRISSVHLQHRAKGTATRLAELATLLAEQPAAGPRIVAGDLNAVPGGPEIAAMTNTGWVSALDEAGGTAGAASLTSPSDAPTSRIDWVFGQGVTFADAAVLTDPRSSDHLPVVTTVSVAP
jgi:endonuclease/exonuclease/phosphatase family metal-dependent hydrolase